MRNPRGPMGAFLGAFACALTLAAHLGAQEAPDAAPPATLEALRESIDTILSDSVIPGASVVIIEDRAIAEVHHYGVADRESLQAVTADTVFRAGSISKSLTGIAAMMLVEQGAIALDAEVRAWLPEIELDNPWRETEPVRLVHLLEHTAGFNDIAFRHYLIEGGGMPLGEAVQRFGPYRSRWRPGTLTSYSNQGPIVAARMLEIAAGEPLDSFVARHITTPLGMATASWRYDPDRAARQPLASSYRPDGVTPERFVDTPAWPSGGLNITAIDLARLPLLLLGRGTLDGTTLLSPASVARIETPRSNDAARQGLRHGYGLGNVVKPGGKAVFFGHDGSIDGFVATFAYAPELGGGWVVMANATSGAIYDVADAIREYLERDLGPPNVEPIAEPAGEIENWAGQYQVLTPRRALLAGLIGLTQWEGAVVNDGQLRFRGATWLPVGGARWQQEDAAVPGLVVLDRDGQRRIQTAMSAYRQVPAVEMWIKLLALGGFALLLVVSIPHAIAVAYAGVRGRLADRGGAALRIWPLTAFYGVVGTVVITLALFQTGDLEFIGRPTWAAWGLFAWSAFVPLWILLAALSLFRRRPGAGRFASGLAASYVLFAALGCVYLAVHGWIGLRLWNA